MGIGFSRPAGDIPGDFDQPAGEGAGQDSLSTTREREVAEDGPPYPPSWADRLIDWVRRLPLPAWVSYLALGLGLSLLLMSTAWVGGALPPGTFVLDYFLSAMTCAYFLALIHFLDESAAAALARFRPVMTVDDAGYNKLYYQLTTLPGRPALIASGLGAVYSLGTLLVSIFIDENPGLGAVSPIVPIVEVSFRTLIYALIGVVVYHTLHQLRMVNAIYTKHTRINLFQLGPIYALSSLTARTAIGIGIPTYVWFQVTSLSAPGNSPSDIFETVFMGIVMVATFIWPLVGAHNLLEREKQRLKDEVAQRIEATIAVLHSSVDTATLEPRGAFKDTLDGLVIEQGVIDKLRTWPWRTETVSGLGFAFLLPIIIWVVQRMLERLGI